MRIVGARLLFILATGAAFGLVTFSAAAESCLAEVSEAEAALLVERCLEVSPASRPPCNAENDCNLVIEEIVRGCEMLGDDAPAYCDDYATEQPSE